jgi:glycosyltransferase involved in cell wall biosynthesis
MARRALWSPTQWDHVRLRILWLTPRIACPPDTGGTIVTYYLLQHLAARGHHLTVWPLSEVRGTPNLGESIEIIPRTFPLPHRHSVGRLLLSTLTVRPYAISRYLDRRAFQEIVKALAPPHYDVVHVDHLHLAEYGLALQLPRVLLMHNVESVLWERLAAIEAHPIKKIFEKHQADKLRRYEREVLSQYDAIVALSPLDAARLQQLCPWAHVVAIPPGVDDELFHPLNVGEEPYSVVFVGPLDWVPNVDGARWFCREIWPKVKAHVPQARCYIVGRCPPRDLYAHQDVIVMGYVPDVARLVARASVFIVPVRIGSGVRVKILHALAMGKAVVTTSVGCEGLELSRDEHVWVADTAQEFADGVSTLLQDAATRRRLGGAGMQCVRTRYRWPNAAEALEALYHRLCTRRS